jgi:toxin ParE1/3/4
MDIRWTEKASSDTLGIFDYIADQSLAYAESVYERILERPMQLPFIPSLEPLCPNLDVTIFENFSSIRFA